MGQIDAHNLPPARARIRWALAGFGCIAALGLGAAAAFAQPSIDDLNSRIAGAKQQAEALGAEIESTTARLAAAQEQAIVAAQREAQLTAVLDQGRERERQLEAAVTRARAALAAARDQLGRSLNALSNRLVAIYRDGMPDQITILLEADGFDDLQTRAEYLRRIEQADAALVARVRALRNRVSNELAAVAEAEARAEAINAQIEAARDQIAAVRADAEAQAAQLAALREQRQAAVETLQSQVGQWTDEVQRLERISARQAAGAVGDWFGDWAIPESIVMCESGGNFEAVNPTSGAGGAYQILPSTWDLYGGEGQPEDAAPGEQSEIAAQIWADSGAAAWVCAD